MREVNKKQMIQLAKRGCGQFSAIMNEAWEQFKSALDLALSEPEAMFKLAAAQTKILEDKLKKAGYVVVKDDGLINTVKVMVYKAKPGTSDVDFNELWASGQSNTYDDALHHAFLGAIREEVARSTIKAEAEKRNLIISKDFKFYDSPVAVKSIGQPDVFWKLERAIVEGQFSEAAVAGCGAVLDSLITPSVKA